MIQIENIDEDTLQSILKFFNVDYSWYIKAREKIVQIEKSLPEKINGEDKIIKMYGWIKNETIIQQNLRLPLISNYELSCAMAIELVFNGKIDLYEKCLRWD